MTSVRIPRLCWRTLTMVTHPFSNPVEQDLTSKNKQWWFFRPGQSQGHGDSILFNACTEVPQG